MAHRLTSAAPAGSVSIDAGADSTDGAARLRARAEVLLAEGDVAAYRSLFSSAAVLADPNRRYHAQVVLLELGLAVAAAGTSVPPAALRAAVADAAVEVLEGEPREPVVLNCAALALYELWSLDAARTLWEAAGRLDPSLPHLHDNLAAVQSRRRARSTRTGPPPLARPARLERRAELVAGKARPATGLTLSLCMIVRDEEEMLPRCLAAAAPAVDEIIVVDTGSRDGTIQIARSFGARVIEHEWTDSFAQARNLSFAAATGDWLMFLDADQVLVAEDADQLRALTGHTWREAFYLVETSYVGEMDDGYAVTDNMMRVVRNRPQYRFEGRVHEQITHTLPLYAPRRVEHTSVRVRHYGYLETIRDTKGKSRRNVELLRAQADEDPTDAFLHFNLGSEYAAGGDAASALSEFERAWAMIVAEGKGANYAYAPPLVARLVGAMRACGRLEDAASLAAEGLRRWAAFTDLVFAQANMAFANGEHDRAAGYYRRCIDLGDAPARYRPIVGCGTYLPRIALAELALIDGDGDAARRLLDWCIEHHPDVPGVVRPYVALLLSAGVTPEEAVAEIERRAQPLSPTARLTLASALMEADALQAAERQYRLAIADQAGSGEAHVGLAQTLLCLGENADAATHAAVVVDDDRYGAQASRILLSGLITGGEVQAASEVLDGGEARLSATEREMFGAWLGAASGTPRASPLPAPAAGLLVAILDTLLRARSFDEFEVLVAVLEGSDLPARQRRELLAETYLRRGFAASAAREWMAVCAEQPDAGALVGLARVALGHDQLQDAAVFATGALELEPENAAAAEILAGVG